jgi:hypothetical protein
LAARILASRVSAWRRSSGSSSPRFPLPHFLEPIEFGSVTEFAPEACDHCDLRPKCTAATPGTGRSVNIAEDERLQHRLTKHLTSSRRASAIQNLEAIQRKVA